MFVINPKSGPDSIDFQSQISVYFEGKRSGIEFFQIRSHCEPTELRQVVLRHNPELVVAVGGDGTLKLVAESIFELQVQLGIIPTGSANGLARELGIPTQLIPALEILEKGNLVKIHLVKINDQLCIHLADIGLNAFMVKKFEQNQKRGLWGYLLAALKTFWKRYRMQFDLELDGQRHHYHAFMLVFANATRYGTGAWINPIGRLDDDQFEVVVIRRISIWDGLKLGFGLKTWEPKAIRVFQGKQVHLKLRKEVHFQVDGEYLGKVKEIKAELMPACLSVRVPV